MALTLSGSQKPRINCLDGLPLSFTGEMRHAIGHGVFVDVNIKLCLSSSLVFLPSVVYSCRVCSY